MKHTVEMKKYVANQIIGLTICCAPWLFLLYIYEGHKYYIVLVIFFLIFFQSCAYFCKPTLLLPLDLLTGEVERTAYFSRMSIGSGYDFSKKNFCEWKFYSSKGTLEVIVPVALTEDEICTMERPQVDQKVKVRYYRFSKLLRSWEVV